jgi:hypothetical protein
VTTRTVVCGEVHPLLAEDKAGEVPIVCGLPRGHDGVHVDSREPRGHICLVRCCDRETIAGCSKHPRHSRELKPTACTRCGLWQRPCFCTNFGVGWR